MLPNDNISMSVGHLDQTGHRGEIFEGRSKESKEHKRQSRRYGCHVICERTFARILKSHGIATANHPHRTLWNFVVHRKDKVRDEEKTELIYRVHCKKCFSSYVGERQEVRSEDQGTQERSRLFHSWYTDPSLHGKVE